MSVLRLTFDGTCEHCGSLPYAYICEDGGTSWCLCCADANDLVTPAQYKAASAMLLLVDGLYADFKRTAMGQVPKVLRGGGTS